MYMFIYIYIYREKPPCVFVCVTCFSFTGSSEGAASIAATGPRAPNN